MVPFAVSYLVEVVVEALSNTMLVDDLGNIRRLSGIFNNKTCDTRGK